jgi:hypothetical protein
MKAAQSAAFICLRFSKPQKLVAARSAATSFWFYIYSKASFAIDIKKQRSAERRSALLCF